MTISKAQVFDYAILILRWYLAFYMLSYGWGKATGGQFGLSDPTLLDKPLREIGKFQLAWYLFSLDKTFNVVTGGMQILGAGLLVFNRTALLGALLLLPILGQIFLVDLAFTTDAFGPNLVIRLAGMIGADLAILAYHKNRLLQVWEHLTASLTPKFKYPLALTLLLPVFGFLTDFVLALLTFPLKMLFGK